MPPASHSDRVSAHRQRTIDTRDSASTATKHQRGRILQSVRWSVFMKEGSGCQRAARGEAVWIRQAEFSGLRWGAVGA